MTEKATIDPEVIRVIEEINTELPLLTQSPEVIHYDDSGLSVDLIIDYEIATRQHYYYSLRIYYSKYEYKLSLNINRARDILVLYTTETHYDLSKLVEEIVKEIEGISNECTSALITEDELEAYTTPTTAVPTSSTYHLTNNKSNKKSSSYESSYGAWWENEFDSSFYGNYSSFVRVTEPIDEGIIDLIGSELSLEAKT